MPLVIGKFTRDDGGKIIDASQIDTFDDMIPLFFSIGKNQTFEILDQCKFPFSVQSMWVWCSSGDIEFTPRINATAITGLPAVSGTKITSSKQRLTASALNLTVVDDSFDGVFANNNNAVDIHIEFHIIRYGVVAGGGGK
jgi:hypothetical protein